MRADRSPADDWPRPLFFPLLDFLCFFLFFVLLGFSCTRYNPLLSIPRELLSLLCCNPKAPSLRLLLRLPLLPLLPRRRHVGESICLCCGYTPTLTQSTQFFIENPDVGNQSHLEDSRSVYYLYTFSASANLLTKLLVDSSRIQPSDPSQPAPA